MLARSPGFATVAVVSLAVGIGANCAVFSFADTLLLRPLNVPQPAGVLTVGLKDPFSDSLAASYRDYVDLASSATSFEGLVAFGRSIAGFAVRPGDAPKLTMGLVVSGNFFTVLGVAPHVGRDFRPDEASVPDRDAVVILSHELWANQLGRDPSIVGRTIRLNGIEFTVVGVAAGGFTGLDQYARFQFYVPLTMWPRLADPGARPLDARNFRRLTIAGRLRPGVTQAAAQSELTLISAAWERAWPETNRNQHLVVRTELQKRIAQAPPVAALLALLALLSAAVLAVACANVAGLLASRAPTRAHEIALRLAIGASRARVTRQLIVESLLIAMLGGALGLIVGFAAVQLFGRIQIPTDLPISAEFRLDGRALTVSGLTAVLSVLLFGLAPAIAATRTDLTALIKATDTVADGRRRWFRALLVGGQIAMAVVLLALAAFVYRGFDLQLAAGPGFATDRLLMMSIAPAQLHYDDAQSRMLFERLAGRARLVPGVVSAGLTRYMPMDGLPPSITVVPEGVQFPPGREGATHAMSIVDERYFGTLGVPIVKGRGFLSTDSERAPRVAVVNEVFADRYWPGQDPIGKRFRVDGNRGAWVQIVGVARTTKYSFLIERPREFVYLPFRQRSAESMFVLVKTAGDASSLTSPLREIVRQLDPAMPIASTRTMAELYRMRSVEVLNVIATLTGALGLMGLALALGGLYALVAYAASRRTKEIGIRMAMGATRANVAGLVLRQGIVPSIGGLGVGLIAALAAGRALAIVFPGGAAGTGRTDLVAFASVAALVFAVTQLAAWLPARRASRINPTDALRCE
jgi:predicted permease